MPAYETLAKCCDTCKHFECVSGWNIGQCALSRNAVELSLSENGKGNGEGEGAELWSTMYTTRSGWCRNWTARNGPYDNLLRRHKAVLRAIDRAVQRDIEPATGG